MKKYFVKKTSGEVEPHETLLDSLVQKHKAEGGVKELKFEVPPSPKPSLWFVAVFFILTAVILGKTFQLAVMQNKDFKELSDKNSARLSPIRTDRGVIYDKNFEKLVSNFPGFDLVLDARDLPKDENQKNEVIKLAAQITKKDPVLLEDLVAQRLDTGEKIVVAENLEQETLVALETKIDELPGFQIERNTIRNYVDPEFFSQILGFTGRINSSEYTDLKSQNYSISDYLGKQGLEKSYEKILRGEPGIFETDKNALGQTVGQKVRTEAKPGQSLVLWLDASLQRKLQTELSRVASDIGLKKAAAVALDPKTGGVLALVSLPSFDNNAFSGASSQADLNKILNNPSQPLFNRAISGQYASGSSIKPLVATAALQENIILPTKQIYSQGFISVTNQYHPEIVYTYHDTALPGWYDMRKAIALSCNVYFYTIGGSYKDQKGLGSTRLKNYLKLFGWGEKTGIDLPGESKGLVPDHVWKEETLGQPWSTGDTYNLSIGQGYLQVTPLQLATAFTALANHGKLMKPQIVKQIIEDSPSDNNVIKEFAPVIARNTGFNQENLNIILQGMRDGVVYGSSAILNDLPVKAAAKTGTAQTSKSNYYYNWVTVIAPYDNPQIVLTVILEDVPGVRAAALPVANEVLKWYFSK